MSALGMTLTKKIAEDTWWKVKWSWDHKFLLGEETLTQLLVLDFVRFMPDYYKLHQCTKKEESQQGTDLEIRIYDVGTQAAKLAVQAKKLYQANKPYQTGGYYRLDTKAKSQMDILETYSRGARAIPLYLLYNYVDRCDISRYWHCCQCPDKKQLGCTLVPSRNIRQAFKNYKLKNFDWIHKSRGVLPWHCLFDCTQRRGHQGQTAARRSLSLLSELFGSSDDLSMVKTALSPSDDVQDHDGVLFEPDDEQNYDWVNFDPVEGAWPEWLWERSGTTLSAEDRRQLWGDLGETVATPRHLLLVKESD